MKYLKKILLAIFSTTVIAEVGGSQKAFAEGGPTPPASQKKSFQSPRTKTFVTNIKTPLPTDNPSSPDSQTTSSSSQNDYDKPLTYSTDSSESDTTIPSVQKAHDKPTRAVLHLLKMIKEWQKQGRNTFSFIDIHKEFRSESPYAEELGLILHSFDFLLKVVLDYDEEKTQEIQKKLEENSEKGFVSHKWEDIKAILNLGASHTTLELQKALAKIIPQLFWLYDMRGALEWGRIKKTVDYNSQNTILDLQKAFQNILSHPDVVTKSKRFYEESYAGLNTEDIMNFIEKFNEIKVKYYEREKEDETASEPDKPVLSIQEASKQAAIYLKERVRQIRQWNWRALMPVTDLFDEREKIIEKVFKFCVVYLGERHSEWQYKKFLNQNNNEGKTDFFSLYTQLNDDINGNDKEKKIRDFKIIQGILKEVLNDIGKNQKLFQEILKSYQKKHKVFLNEKMILGFLENLLTSDHDFLCFCDKKNEVGQEKELTGWRRGDRVIGR